MPQEAALGHRICSLWPSPAAGRRRLPARGSGLRVTHGSLRGEGQELARPQEAEGVQPRAVDGAVEAPCHPRHATCSTGGRCLRTFLVTIDCEYTAVDEMGTRMDEQARLTSWSRARALVLRRPRRAPRLRRPLRAR